MILTVHYNNSALPAWEIGFGETLEAEAYESAGKEIEGIIRSMTGRFTDYFLPDNSGWFTAALEDNGAVQTTFGRTSRFRTMDFRHILSMLMYYSKNVSIDYIYDAENGVTLTNIGSFIQVNSTMIFPAHYKLNDGREGDGSFALPLLDSLSDKYSEQMAYDPMGSFGLFPISVPAASIELTPLSTKLADGFGLGCYKYGFIHLFYGKVGNKEGVFCRQNGEYVLLGGKNADITNYEYRDISALRSGKNRSLFFDKKGVSLGDFNRAPFYITNGKAKLDVSELDFPEVKSYPDAEKAAKRLLDAFSRAVDLNRDLFFSDNRGCSANLSFSPRRRTHVLSLGKLSFSYTLHEKRLASYNARDIDFIQTYVETEATRIEIESNGKTAAFLPRDMIICFGTAGSTAMLPLNCFYNLLDESAFPKELYSVLTNQYINEPDYAIDYGGEIRNALESLLNIFENKEYAGFFAENAVCTPNKHSERISQILFPEPAVPDEKTVNAVVEAVNRFEITGKIPNLMLMGSAGTGKSTLAKNIAKCFVRADGTTPNVLFCSASSLLGKYVGHTEGRVFDLLKKADKTRSIILIDEAYVLMDSEFGQEAIAMLLPIMVGDRTTIEKIKGDASKENCMDSYTFQNGTPVIWFSGYEDELRRMVAKNAGLIRRFELRLSLKNPSPTRLYDALIRYAQSLPKKWEAFTENNAQLLLEAFELCREDIIAYFRFGTSCENERAFGNYAGMEEFCKSCAVTLSDDMTDDEIKNAVLQIIETKKAEFSRQYTAVLSAAGREPRFAFRVENDARGSFSELVGMKAEKNELSAIIGMLSGQSRLVGNGIRVPRGVLLAGFPGCGKTALARAAAGELRRAMEKNGTDCSAAFISVSASEFLGEKTNPVAAVKALFAQAADYDAAVIFIDEIDAIGTRRERNPFKVVLLELMKQMDGFEKHGNVLVLAATNAPESLDEALTRPGRFDRTLTIELPEKEDRRALVRFFLDRVSGTGLSDMDKDTFAEEFSERTSGFSPADLQNIINSAACLNLQVAEAPAERIAEDFPHRIFGCKGNIPQKHSALDNFRLGVSETMDRLFIGSAGKAEKETAFSTDKNDGCSAVAVHEVGHGLVSLLLGQKPFEKITVIPRGDALGYVEHDRSQKLRTKKHFLDQIRVLLGGRIAEELFYGEDNITVGAAEDIRKATRLARQLVETFGMSEEFGIMALTGHEGRFLGGEAQYTCSDSFRARADKAVFELISELFSQTKQLLSENLEIHRELARFVFEHESVSGEEFSREFERLSNRVRNTLCSA